MNILHRRLTPVFVSFVITLTMQVMIFTLTPRSVLAVLAVRGDVWAWITGVDSQVRSALVPFVLLAAYMSFTGAYVDRLIVGALAWAMASSTWIWYMSSGAGWDYRQSVAIMAVGIFAF